MKFFLTTVALTASLISSMAFASDPVIPWATNSGGTESTHIAAMGEDLNAQHQKITHTREGIWATNSGSIQSDEAALTSNKPPVQVHSELMPHQG
ncbi:hypothetical protein GW207_16445 [Salmonella enterica subsp. arizonae serovar 40:z4,z32:-]|nr:hypothetical protein [Salmonella enterica subsp. arizonae]EEF7981148.1 hypothetical protein [Salmonella enterica subsp. arizonae serovar 40:z4,z32:-]